MSDTSNRLTSSTPFSSHNTSISQSQANNNQISGHIPQRIQPQIPTHGLQRISSLDQKLSYENEQLGDQFDQSLNGQNIIQAYNDVSQQKIDSIVIFHSFNFKT